MNVGDQLGIPFDQSPNCDRTGSNRQLFIVLHGSGGPEAATRSWIGDPSAKVSYHYTIPKDATSMASLLQVVLDRDVAWHAGYSRWAEQSAVAPPIRRWAGLNRYSISIGLESLNRADEVYPENQLQACRALVLALMDAYQIPASRILTHRMISDPPGRKVDPVNFPFEDFIRSVANHQDPDVTNHPRIAEVEGLRLFLDNEHAGRVAAARIVGDKLYINRAEEA